MEKLICRLLPFAVADGPENMAADEALLQTAKAGQASLRFYGWSEPTLSLGYFQPQAVRQEDARIAALPFVRRPSGGAALVHHHEVTYALALPAGWRRGGSWLTRMHRIIATALEKNGVACQVFDGKGQGLHLLHSALSTQYSALSPLCFQQFTPGDLLIDAAKVVGSAQRKQRGALLQHGAILLASSPHAPALPGIQELTGKQVPAHRLIEAVLDVFSTDVGVGMMRESWTPAERQHIAETRVARYTQDAWNCKR